MVVPFMLQNNGGGAPTFDLPLVNMNTGVFTIAPLNSTGSGTPTFTRATAATTIDFEGLLKTCLSGEVRCLGGRRVRNMLNTTSEDFAAAAWNSNGHKTLQVADGGIAPPSVASSVDKLYEAAAGAGSIAHRMTNSVTTVLGNTYVAQVRAKKGERKRIFLYHFQRGAWFDLDLGTTGADSVYPTSVESAIGLGSDGYYLCTMKFTANFTGTDDFFVHVGSDAQTTITATRVGDGASGLYASAVQLENVTGQSSQNPSEYVSVGVLSAPVYHGVGVDGVKVFTTLNGNTVASNVVTEATGASITSAQGACAGGVTAGVVDATGPVGYLPEGARTNLCLYSQDLTNAAWAKSGSTVVADQGPTGMTYMDSLVEDSGTSLHYAYTNAAVITTPGVNTFSVDVKAGTRNFLQLAFNDYGVGGVGVGTCAFNASTGAVGTASVCTGALVETLPDGVYRFSITFTTASTTANVQLRLCDADNSPTYTGNGTGNLLFGNMQVEAGAFASSRIPTTTAAVTRNADVLTYVAAGNVNGVAGSVYAEVTEQWTGALGTANRLFDIGANRLPLYMNSAKLSIYDGATEGLNITFTADTSVQKVASNWGGTTMNVFVGGVAGTPAAFDGNMDVGATLYVGTGSIGNPWFGSLRNVRIYPRALSAAQLQAMTT